MEEKTCCCLYTTLRNTYTQLHISQQQVFSSLSNSTNLAGSPQQNVAQHGDGDD